MSNFMDSNTITEVISSRLTSLGLSDMRLGYTYIVCAVEEILYDESLMMGITKKLYPRLAARFCTTPEAVERDIRTAITNACKSPNDTMQCFMGDAVHFTNKGFIYRTVAYAKRHTKKWI